LVALHSTINSETGSFIQDGAYEIVRDEDAAATAQGFCDQAWEWCFNNGIRYNRRNCERDQRRFLQYVQQLVKGA
jgi:hypothetical protein